MNWNCFSFFVGILLMVLSSEAMAGLLDLNRVLGVNALIASGNHNGGNGVSKNEVGGKQDFWQRIQRKKRDDDDR